MKIATAIVLVAVLFASNTIASAAPPGFFDVAIGSHYPTKSPFKDIGEGRTLPTIQFRVPNSGPSAEMFPEYEVVLNRANNEVSILSVRKVFETMEMCQESSKAARGLISKEFPSLEYSSQKRSYSSPKENVFVKISCTYGEDDPYPTLEVQIRGKRQDAALKDAWNEYFSKQR